MRYLLTGMTAAQTNPQYHVRSPNFPGLLADSLTLRHDVTWSEPSVEWDNTFLSQFDRVIVGVSPLTGLGANRAYGALNVIERLWDSFNLRLLVDAPDPLKMESASQSIVDHPENLDKDFFSFRKEFKLVRSDASLKARLLKAVDYLCNEPWPATIVPQLPWQSSLQFERQLPNARKLVLLNLDQVLFKNIKLPEPSFRRDVWAYEKGSHPSWLRKTQTTWPTEHLPRTHRRPIVDETLTQLQGSEGCLIVPSKTGTWWSPRYAMSLAVATAVFTDWHETQFLSGAWAYLPTAFELMNPQERIDLVAEQITTYKAALPKEDTWTVG